MAALVVHAALPLASLLRYTTAASTSAECTRTSARKPAGDVAPHAQYRTPPAALRACDAQTCQNWDGEGWGVQDNEAACCYFATFSVVRVVLATGCCAESRKQPRDNPTKTQRPQNGQQGASWMRLALELFASGQ